MRLTFLFLTIAACLVFGQPRDQIVTNESVAEMVRAGVAQDVIIGTINRSECRFLLDSANLIWLKKAGVPDDIVRVMAAKASGRVAPPAPVPVSSAASEPSKQPEYRTPEPPVERITNVAGETDDWDFGLGTVAVQVGGGLSAGTDRPTRTVAPVINGELNVGLNRYISLLGAYAYHPLGTVDYLECTRLGCVLLPIKVRAHEFTGGVKVTIPTSTRFTPFFTGSAGAFRVSAGANVLGIGVSASDSAFIGGGGGGFRVNLTRHLALDYDARLFFGQYDLFYGRTTLGLLIRFN